MQVQFYAHFTSSGVLVRDKTSADRHPSPRASFLSCVVLYLQRALHLFSRCLISFIGQNGLLNYCTLFILQLLDFCSTCFHLVLTSGCDYEIVQ